MRNLYNGSSPLYTHIQVDSQAAKFSCVGKVSNQTQGVIIVGAPETRVLVSYLIEK